MKRLWGTEINLGPCNPVSWSGMFWVTHNMFTFMTTTVWPMMDGGKMNQFRPFKRSSKLCCTRSSRRRATSNRRTRRIAAWCESQNLSPFDDTDQLCFYRCTSVPLYFSSVILWWTVYILRFFQHWNHRLHRAPTFSTSRLVDFFFSLHYSSTITPIYSAVFAL